MKEYKVQFVASDGSIIHEYIHDYPDTRTARVFAVHYAEENGIKYSKIFAQVNDYQKKYWATYDRPRTPNKGGKRGTKPKTFAQIQAEATGGKARTFNCVRMTFSNSIYESMCRMAVAWGGSVKDLIRHFVAEGMKKFTDDFGIE